MIYKLFEDFNNNLSEREIKIIKGYGIKHPEFIEKWDGYYSIWDKDCEDIKDIPNMYRMGIMSFCEKYSNRIKYYFINEDFTVDTEDVHLVRSSLKRLPFKFNNVHGYFTCRGNDLTSLSGSPNKVDEYFDVSYNNINSLKGSPHTVGGNFYCQHNNLTTFEGSPLTVGGYFDGTENPLISKYLKTKVRQAILI